MKSNKSGFTLIELLILATIIAVLAAIADSKSFEGKVRSEVSRLRLNLHAYATALEAYRLDNNRYPFHAAEVYGGTSEQNFSNTDGLARLNIPIAYMTTGALNDPFGAKRQFHVDSGAPPQRGLEFCGLLLH